MRKNKKNKRARNILKLQLILYAISILVVFFFIILTLYIFLSMPGNFRPEPGKTVTIANPEISFKYSSSPNYIKQVILNEKDVTGELHFRGNRVSLTEEILSEGEHRVEISYYPPLPIWPIKRSWSFFVDTSPPVITVYEPKMKNITITGKNITISGKTEAKSTLEIVKDNKSKKLKPDEKGNFKEKFVLNPGKNIFKIISKDRAGNKSEYDLEVFFDSTPPELSDPFPPDGKIVNEVDPLISAAIKEDGVIEEVIMKINGKEVPCEITSGMITCQPEKLSEGTHNIEIMVKDSAGLEDTLKWAFTVDSTEQFGKRTQILGARGEDVKDLQKLLGFHGYLEQKNITGNFDEKTLEAVKEFQKEKDITPDGVVGPATVDIMSFYIIVDLDDFTLSLMYDGDVIKDYYIACGSLEYPTPTGEFIITSKIKDPTWIPPDSPWAKEAEITAPGEDNPLGTRWLELNSSLVGIHGTNYPVTIGLNVSHGCIRMDIPDVEDLYEYVNIGTRVTIKDQIIPPTPIPIPTSTPLPPTEKPEDNGDDDETIIIQEPEDSGNDGVIHEPENSGDESDTVIIEEREN